MDRLIGLLPSGRGAPESSKVRGGRRIGEIFRISGLFPVPLPEGNRKSDNKSTMEQKKTGILYVLTVHSESYRNNLFYDEVRRGINIEANIRGLNAEFLFGFDYDPDRFSDADGIIFAPDGSEQCASLLRVMKARYGIPIVQIDNQVYDDALKPPVDIFLGTDNFHGGVVTAEYLASFLPKKSPVLVLSGSEHFPYLSYNDRLKGITSTGYFDIRTVLYGEFDLARVHDILEEYFRLGNEMPSAILAFNDDSAIAARKVLNMRGLGEKVLVTGFDGSAAGRVALSRGDIICSYDQDPERLGTEAVRAYVRITEGSAPIERVRLIRGPLLTAGNIGCTFYAGVTDFLDRTLTPFSFRKRRYERVDAESCVKPLRDYRNELICPIISGPVEDLGRWLRCIDADKFILVSDNNKFLYSERLRLETALKNEGFVMDAVGFPGGEKNKNPETLIALANEILGKKITKKSCLVLVGGGITGNIGGFVASILYRGIRFVHVPTTVMHMVDSSTGGKQAVDSAFGKNSLGNFFEPEFIYIDEQYLLTLPDREIRSGLAECVKHALCQDSEFCETITKNADLLFEGRDVRLWREIVNKTIRLKTLLMEADSYEINEGMAMVYGHTLGNAVESTSGYSITHGEAVSIGMVAAAEISERLGIGEPGLREAHEQILSSVGLPIRIPKDLSDEKIMEFLLFDKKYTSDPLAFVLLRNIGSLYMKEGRVPQPVPESLVREVIRWLSE
jgi:3-dehydroquinate synthase